MKSWFKKIWVEQWKTLTTAVTAGRSYVQHRLDANSGDSLANGASTLGALINTRQGADKTLLPQTTVFKITVVLGSDPEVLEGNILWCGKNPARLELWGFWPRDRRKGALGAVHGAGRTGSLHIALFRCLQTNARCKNEKGTKSRYKKIYLLGGKYECGSLGGSYFYFWAITV